VITAIGTLTTIGTSPTYAWIDPNTDPVKKAPIAIVGDNV
jgi:hypothetical protein